MTREERRIIYFLVASVALGSLVILVLKRGRPKPVPITWRDESEERGPSHPEPVDVNVATPEELMRIPGIGPVLAQRIVECRVRTGGFVALEDLRDVKGIGEKKLQEIRPYLVPSEGKVEGARGSSGGR